MNSDFTLLDVELSIQQKIEKSQREVFELQSISKYLDQLLDSKLVESELKTTLNSQMHNHNSNIDDIDVVIGDSKQLVTFENDELESVLKLAKQLRVASDNNLIPQKDESGLKKSKYSKNSSKSEISNDSHTRSKPIHPANKITSTTSTTPTRNEIDRKVIHNNVEQIKVSSQKTPVEFILKEFITLKKWILSRKSGNNLVLLSQRRFLKKLGLNDIPRSVLYSYLNDLYDASPNISCDESKNIQEELSQLEVDYVSELKQLINLLGALDQSMLFKDSRKYDLLLKWYKISRLQDLSSNQIPRFKKKNDVIPPLKELLNDNSLCLQSNMYPLLPNSSDDYLNKIESNIKNYMNNLNSRYQYVSEVLISQTYMKNILAKFKSKLQSELHLSKQMNEDWINILNEYRNIYCSLITKSQNFQYCRFLNKTY